MPARKRVNNLTFRGEILKLIKFEFLTKNFRQSLKMTDEFYTKPETVLLCLQELKKLYFFENEDVIVEPSAGDGAFLSVLCLLTDFVVGYDINPKSKYILKQDFLKIEHPVKPINSKMYVVGCPPFSDELLHQFIQKSCKIADVIGFILPKTFKPVFDNFNHIKTIDLPDNSFRIIPEDESVELSIPCEFQIWERKVIF